MAKAGFYSSQYDRDIPRRPSSSVWEPTGSNSGPGFHYRGPVGGQHIPASEAAAKHPTTTPREEG